MKALVLALAVFAGTAQATTNVCVNMPDGVKAETILANFDGSISYSGISVFAEGEYRRVWSSSFAATGLCKLWGNTGSGTLLVFNEAAPNSGEMVAVVKENGNYGGSYKESDYRNVKILSTVTCK